jgi:hypothetical protein
LQRNTDTERFVTGIDRQIDALAERVADEDPWVPAEMLRLSEKLERLAWEGIDAQRRRGVRWEDIAFELGVSASVATKRWLRRFRKRNVAPRRNVTPAP